MSARVTAADCRTRSQPVSAVMSAGWAHTFMHGLFVENMALMSGHSTACHCLQDAYACWCQASLFDNANGALLTHALTGLGRTAMPRVSKLACHGKASLSESSKTTDHHMNNEQMQAQ